MALVHAIKMSFIGLDNYHTDTDRKPCLVQSHKSGQSVHKNNAQLTFSSSSSDIVKAWDSNDNRLEIHSNTAGSFDPH